MPERIQRRRVRGWSKPEGSVYVGRPTRWGNPFRPGAPVSIEYGGGEVIDATDAVALFAVHLRRRPELAAAARMELAGRDLLCWCPVGEPCHADVLLEAAASPDLPPDVPPG